MSSEATMLGWLGHPDYIASYTDLIFFIPVPSSG